MPSAVDPLFNDPTYRSLALSMDAAAVRHGAIASNIANISTPGYKRVDLSAGFQNAMAQALRQLDQTGTTTSSLPTPSISQAADQGLARQDGNTVNLEKEMVGLLQNQSHFDFAAQMTAKSLRSLRMAATGRSSG